MPYNLMYIEDRTVLYVDYRNLSSDGIVQLARKVDEVTEEQDEGLIFIVNVKGAVFTTQVFVQLMSEKVGDIFSKKHKFIVFIGVDGFKKMLLSIFSKMYKVNAYHKNSEKEALDFVKELVYTEQALRV